MSISKNTDVERNMRGNKGKLALIPRQFSWNALGPLDRGYLTTLKPGGSLPNGRRVVIAVLRARSANGIVTLDGSGTWQTVYKLAPNAGELTSKLAALASIWKEMRLVGFRAIWRPVAGTNVPGRFYGVFDYAGDNTTLTGEQIENKEQNAERKLSQTQEFRWGMQDLAYEGFVPITGATNWRLDGKFDYLKLAVDYGDAMSAITGFIEYQWCIQLSEQFI